MNQAAHWRNADLGDREMADLDGPGSRGPTPQDSWKMTGSKREDAESAKDIAENPWMDWGATWVIFT
jgi:hypothetical protein